MFFHIFFEVYNIENDRKFKRQLSLQKDWQRCLQ